MQKEKMTLLLNEWTYFPPVGRIEASTVGYGNTPFTTSNAAFRMGNTKTTRLHAGGGDSFTIKTLKSMIERQTNWTADDLVRTGLLRS
jgi:hypothetical protein